jgi:hypothetical protein
VIALANWLEASAVSQRSAPVAASSPRTPLLTYPLWIHPAAAATPPFTMTGEV